MVAFVVGPCPGLRCDSLRSSSAWPGRSRQKPAKAGGARRDRTDDLMLAKHALSQLSYGPVTTEKQHASFSKAMPAIVLRRACRADRRQKPAKAGGPGKT